MSDKARHYFDVFREEEDGIVRIRPVELELAPNIGNCYQDHECQTLYMIVRFLNLDGNVTLVVRPTNETHNKVIKNFL